MAYLSQDDTRLIPDLLARKEYYWLKKWENTKDKDFYKDIIPRFLLEESIMRSGNLKLLSYQMFVQNYMNPNTPYKRLLMQWDTGTGKTIGVLSIAMTFIEHFRLEKEMGHTEIGSVFVIGFSERVFKNELLRFPEFGFLSKEERLRLDKLKRIAAVGGKVDIERYHDMVSKIKKRFGNRKGNGFFKFLGFKAFVNRLFKTPPNININTLSEEQIRIYIAQGKITFNKELMREFNNSLIIGDEIHNVYNSNEQNNYGIALQTVLDHVPTCRAVFTSATPLNNSPTEIIDLLNLLLPVEMRLNKRDFFENDRKLKPGALEKIGELSRGRVSFLRDVNPKYYPELITEGEELKEIPYLKFIRCPMSKFHYDTYKSVYTGVLSQDSQYLQDFALENPDPTVKIGLFQTNQIKGSLSNAPQKWKDKYGLDYRDNKIVGDALRYDTLGKYSSKYVRMLDEIYDVIRLKRGKIFIYHNVVHMSGVLFIEQVLLKNGFIDESSSSSDNTLCMKCGKTRKEHSEEEIIGINESVIGGKTRKEHSEEEIIGMNDGGSETPNRSIVEKEIRLKKKKHRYIWQTNDKIMMVVEKKKNPKIYYIKANSLDDSLIKGESHALKDFSHILNTLINLQNIPIEIEVPAYAPRFGEWLLHLHFDLKKQTLKHSIMAWNSFQKKGCAECIDVKHLFINDSPIHVKESNEGGNSSEDSKLTELVESTELVDNIINTVMHETALPEGGRYVKIVKSKNHKHNYNHRHNYNHKFTPARFIMAHSEIDKAHMEHSLEKFNSPDNADGSRFMILVASKIMKEAYDIKAIQNVFIMNRPDNIPTLIQIRGRAVRKHSHRDLPLENRVVRLKIFTSCLPEKQTIGLDKGKYKLSYEEEKYKEKIAAFQVMQKIEKVLHENAVDAFINHDLITRANESMKDPLTSLSFVPNTSAKFNREFTLSELNLSTFNIYHAHKEVEIIKTLIKRLFIEISSVWEYSDLYEAVKNPINYETEFNTHLFSEENFIIALDQLAWNNDKNYIEPLINKQHISNNTTIADSHEGGIDYLRFFGGVFDAEDRFVAQRNRGVAYQETGDQASKNKVGGGNHIQEIYDYIANDDGGYNKSPERHVNNCISGGNVLYMDSITLGAKSELKAMSTPAVHHNHPSYIIDRLYDTNDKIITLPGGQDSIIIPIANDIKQYYILFPVNYDTNEPDIDLELPYRVVKQEQQQTINMNNFVKTKRIDFDYDDKKKIFYRRYQDISIDNMENIVCEYGTTFHIKFLEECIEYVFRAWTDPNLEKNTMHEFYFKMLYYYDLLSLVMWAYTTKPKVFKDYTKYAIPVKAKDIKLKVLNKYEKRKEELEDISPDDNSDISTSGIINLLKTSLNRTSNIWIPAEFREHYDKTVDESLRLFAGKIKKNKNVNKVSAQLLPIGHYISKFPRIFHPEKGWTEDPTYSQIEENFIENDVIIGYDDRSASGVHIRFKLRPPVQNIKKYKDSRQIMRGTVCKSKSKPELYAIAKKLDIMIPDKTNVEDLCSMIRSKLIRLELKERVKKSKIKWFYWHFEDNSFHL